jgi:hypothetical protein
MTKLNTDILFGSQHNKKLKTNKFNLFSGAIHIKILLIFAFENNKDRHSVEEVIFREI